MSDQNIEALQFPISTDIRQPGADALDALLKFFETPSDKAIPELTSRCIPSRSILGLDWHPEQPEARIRFPVQGKAAQSDDGVRYVLPRAIPLLRVLTLFGERKNPNLYVMNVTSRPRQKAGHRQLHYVYIFRKPNHIPLERPLADADAMQKVEFIGDHRRLVPSNFRFASDSTRTETGRGETIRTALMLHAAAKVAGESLDLSADRYRSLLISAFDFYGHAQERY